MISSAPVSVKISSFSFSENAADIKIIGIEVMDSVWSFEEETDFGEPGLKQLYYMKFPPYFLTEELGLDFGYHEYLVEISLYNSGEPQVVSFMTGFTLIL